MAVLAIGLFITACSTNNLESHARQLETAVFLGTSLHLRDNLEDRPKFVEARASLATLLSDTNATGTDLFGIIQGLPLKGDAIYYREGALLLLSSLNTPDVPVDTAGFRSLLQASDNGLARGLAAVASAKEVKQKVEQKRARGTNAPAPTSAPRIP